MRRSAPNLPEGSRAALARANINLQDKWTASCLRARTDAAGARYLLARSVWAASEICLSLRRDNAGCSALPSHVVGRDPAAGGAGGRGRVHVDCWPSAARSRSASTGGRACANHPARRRRACAVRGNQSARFRFQRLFKVLCIKGRRKQTAV